MSAESSLNNRISALWEKKKKVEEHSIAIAVWNLKYVFKFPT